VKVLALWLLFAGASFQDSNQINPEALEWFYKGQELSGTELDYSLQQAEFFEKAVKVDPDFAEARYNLAVVYIKQKKVKAALQQLNVWINLKPEDSKGYLLRSRLRMEENQLDKAIKDLQQATKIDSQNYEIWQWLGQIYYRQGQHQEAVQAFYRVLELNPSLVETHLDMALAQHALSQKKEAIIHYKKFLNHLPDDFQANYYLGLIYREMGQNNLALQYFLKAEKKDPNQSDLLEELGNLYLDQNDLEEARIRLLRADQRSVANITNLGVIAKRRDQNNIALEYFDKALSIEPNNSLVWGHQGDVLAEMARKKEAVEAYENALKYDPGDLKTVYNLATLYVELKKLREALNLLQPHLNGEPCRDYLYYLIALVFDQMKDPVNAEIHYQRAIECGIQQPFAHFRLAFLLSRKGDSTGALNHLGVAFEKRSKEYVPVVVNELRKVRSDLDSIRYTDGFSLLLSKYQIQLGNSDLINLKKKQPTLKRTDDPD